MGATGVIPTPQDSVEEFKVNTAGQTADFNSSAGAEIKVVTKRGTSAYHGTVYEYYKDNNWSGNTWQNTLQWHRDSQLPLQPLWRSIGGPLIPAKVFDTKTFFFVNYEGFPLPELRDHRSKRCLTSLADGAVIGLRAVQSVS